MAEQTPEPLEKRVQKAMLQESFFRWESAAVISFTLLLAFFASIDLVIPGPGWAWLLGGALGEAVLVYSSLTDSEFGRKVVAKMLQTEFQPAKIQDEELQQQINQALDYRGRIEEAIRQHSNSQVKDELSQTAGQIDAWMEHIYSLAERIDRYRKERDFLGENKKRAVERVKALEKDLLQEDDVALRNQIESTLTNLRRQLETVATLENTIQRAELQLENTLTYLATIYSQTMLVNVKDIDSGRAKRLRQEISDEVDELQDMLLAMDEVYTAEKLSAN